MLFPPSLNEYTGSPIALWFLVIWNIIGTVRSLIHMFLPDSGAHSIATMNLKVDGRQNIIALLGQWGGAQLIMAFIIWIVLWRYQIFVPLMIAEVAIEQLLRIFIGWMKPLITAGTPPGRPFSFIFLLISTIMLFMSLL